MASFQEHINQAERNLVFLTETNAKSQNFWDWQVTASFYVAVHMVNAHLAKVANLHYRTHEDVKNALNPYNATALCKLEEEVYLAYAKLEMLSRRARYLCPEGKGPIDNAVFTYDKHFARAIRHLDKILNFFRIQYGLTFPQPIVHCQDLSTAEDLKIFSVNPQSKVA